MPPYRSPITAALGSVSDADGAADSRPLAGSMDGAAMAYPGSIGAMKPPPSSTLRDASPQPRSLAASRHQRECGAEPGAVDMVSSRHGFGIKFSGRCGVLHFEGNTLPGLI